MSKKILALFGKSGAGKDRIGNAILQALPQDYYKIVSCTTRPRREGEVEGYDYYYISKETFLELMLQERFVEALEFNGWFYGATVDSLDEEKINIGIFTPEGIEALFQTAGAYDLNILPIYIQCSDKTRLLRALNREESPNVAEICRRYGTDEADFADIDFDYATIMNDNECTDFDDFVKTIDNRCKAFFE